MNRPQGRTRRTTTSLAVGLVTVLAAGTLAAAPAQAVPDGPGGAARAGQAAGGTLTAKNGVLRRGCHRYSYRYSVWDPYDDWMLQLKVVDPRGKAVHAMTFATRPGPAAGRVRYTLCKRSTRPGKFRVTGKLTWYDDPSVPNVVNLKPAVFRLRKPR